MKAQETQRQERSTTADRRGSNSPKLALEGNAGVISRSDNPIKNSSIRLNYTAIVYVVVQFYPCFKFYFLLFQTHYHTLPYPKTLTKEPRIK